jgi:hypothetical protein
MVHVRRGGGVRMDVIPSEKGFPLTPSGLFGIRRTVSLPIHTHGVLSC